MSVFIQTLNERRTVTLFGGMIYFIKILPWICKKIIIVIQKL